MNDQLTLARMIVDEIDEQMFRKGYEKGLRDGREQVTRECAEAIFMIGEKFKHMAVDQHHGRDDEKQG